MRATNDANARGEIGPSRLALSEDGIETLIAHGSTPTKAALIAISMTNKANKGNDEVRPLLDPDDDPVVTGLDVRLGVAALTGKTQQEIDMLAAIARVGDERLKTALGVVAEYAFAENSPIEDRNATEWPIVALVDTDETECDDATGCSISITLSQH